MKGQIRADNGIETGGLHLADLSSSSTRVYGLFYMAGSL